MNLLLTILFTLLPNIQLVRGHGRLIEPPSRASAWRYGFDTPHNYNDHELFCGGFTRQWVKNGGKCGICGDPWDAKLPRAHEYGGTYGQGVIVRHYHASSTIKIKVELTANHHGYFLFSICPDWRQANQECLDSHLLKLARPQDGVEHQGVRYYPKDGNKVYEMMYKLPKGTCEHCILQWRYIAGNNWGNCPNGTGAVGCGPQEEFRACADITIDGVDTPLPTVPTTSTPTARPTTITDHPEVVPTPEDSYSPISTLIVSLISFLVVFLILFLLYFHYYQVGKKIKAWIKEGGGRSKGEKNINKQEAPSVPVAPPRAKRIKRNSECMEKGDLDDVDLSFESLA